MGHRISGEVFVPVTRALRDLNIELRPASDVIKKLKHKKRGDRDGVNDVDTFDGDGVDAPDPTTNRDYVQGNGPAQPRNADGVPEQYTTYYEMTLDQDDWVNRRSVHFNRANADLDAAMNADPDFKDWLEDVSPGIHDRVSATGRRENPNPSDFIWHHAHPDTVNGRHGVMQLVPTFQHTPGSDWWRVLHPGPHGGGGYAIWGKK